VLVILVYLLLAKFMLLHPCLPCGRIYKLAISPLSQKSDQLPPLYFNPKGLNGLQLGVFSHCQGKRLVTGASK